MLKLPPFLPMYNQIQDYAWGSTNSIQSLFAIPNPERKPQAEIWMGAHPNGCSMVELDGEKVRLDDLIKQDMDSILNADTATKFGELPYLFKVLAAEKALSIQVHPNKESAEIGFAKEEHAGIDIKASNRNYKDPNHKPELVYALTPYQAMNGFRDYQDIVDNFEEMNALVLIDILSDFKANLNQAGLTQFFEAILSLEGDAKGSALAALHQYSFDLKASVLDPNKFELGELLLKLEKQYPNDVGLLAPLMLHVVMLQPGEAMFLEACTPHAYIKGTGLEIMANSDNVLRAGLTPKYMDVPELIANTVCVPKAEDKILLEPTTESDDGSSEYNAENHAENNAKHYEIPVEDFNFSVYQGLHSLTCQSAEIIFAIDQDVVLTHESGVEVLIHKGQSVFIPFSTDQYFAKSNGHFARAYN